MPLPPSAKTLQKPRSGTDLHIQQADGEYVRLFVNGVLCAEVFGGKAQTAVDWEAVLRQARMLRVLPRLLRSACERLKTIHNREDHNHPKPNDKAVSYLMGLADGLLGIDDPHPVNKDFEGLNLRMQRDYAPCFCEGFETGEALRQIITAKETE